MVVVVVVEYWSLSDACGVDVMEPPWMILISSMVSYIYLHIYIYICKYISNSNNGINKMSSAVM